MCGLASTLVVAVAHILRQLLLLRYRRGLDVGVRCGNPVHTIPPSGSRWQRLWPQDASAHAAAQAICLCLAWRDMDVNLYFLAGSQLNSSIKTALAVTTR